jgi:hypothetical protein
MEFQKESRKEEFESGQAVNGRSEGNKPSTFTYNRGEPGTGD